MEKLKTVLSLVLALLQVSLYYFMLLWKMVQSFTDYLLVRFFKKNSNDIKCPNMRVDQLQLWNCFSYYPAVTSWDILESQAGKYIGKDKKWHHGRYLFTIDWAHPETNILNTEHSEIPQEHKCAHIIALKNGNYAAQPNNRIIWDIPSFTVKDNIPDWKVQTSEWNVENTSQWRTEDTDKFFYEIEEKKHEEK